MWRKTLSNLNDLYRLVCSGKSYLNVLQPFLVKLLENGEIPHIKVGSHRRILFQDVMIYKEQRKIKRRQGLKELSQFLQDEGFYEESISNLAE
ncbi:excisionase family DNA-binding protein [Microcoleus sp. A2-C5]|uniref:excisionase family DNA-binding protein n=1 Tax=Microcoleaceae TaxID=1892252 RepID=UPI0022390BF5|nr:excisionase family DNA-binding protein [Lyngbya sp. CCAP 1446/10]